MLDSSDTLERLLGFLAHGHPLLEEAAACLAASQSPDGILVARSGQEDGEVGILGDPRQPRRASVRLLLWIGPKSPRTLTLRLPGGHYCVEYWDSRSFGPVGVETASGPTLVLSPPSDRPLAALVRGVEL